MRKNVRKVKSTLIVMVKEPRPGRVKTRLGRDIGVIPATWWFRHQTARLLRRVQEPRWETVLAVAPDPAVTSRAWPGHLPRFAQGRGDLGARIARMLDAVPGQVMLIGGDIPGITPAHIRRGFAALGRSDLVFGPADDGGFWMIGRRRGVAMTHRLDNIRWSSAHTLTDTLGNLRDLRVAQTDVLADVDTGVDLHRIQGATAR